jgi:hypothetical protein
MTGSARMVDALKFAFEILIVGVLALPWLATLLRMFPSDAASSLSLHTQMSIVPKQAQNAVILAAVIAFGYLIGSAVTRVSRNFFNDELWRSVPTEDQIRGAVYNEVYCKEELLSKLTLPSRVYSREAAGICPDEDTLDKETPKERKKIDIRVQELFRLQESLLLLTGQDKVDRLKQYYDQITVLRGAAFNGFVLFVLCVFGSCGNLRAHWSKRPVLGLLSFLPALCLLAYGLFSLWLHLYGKHESPYSDPPFAESVLLSLGFIGLFIISKADRAILYYRACLVAALVTAGSFGGWWWTEIMYDLQVIHSQPELQREAHAAAKSAVAPPASDDAQ